MHLHKFILQDGQARHVMFDDSEAIVELPTKFGFAMANSMRYSRGSVREYMKVLKLFCIELQVLGYKCASQLDEAFASIGSVVIENWLIKLRNQGKDSDTLRMRDAVLKEFMKWLTTQEAGRVRNVWDHPYSDGKLKTIAPHRSAAKYLTYEEVADFIEFGVKNESQRCMIHFMYDTGLRVSEVPRVMHADLPNASDYPESVMYFPLLVHGSKGRGDFIKERYTIISRAVLERIMRLHNNWRVYLLARQKFPSKSMPVFLNVKGGQITSGAIQKMVQTASGELQECNKLLKHITPHCFRHGTAFSLLQSEHGREFLENLVVCQRALGHVSIRTTEIYTMIPAPVIAKIRQLGSPHGFRERFMEAQYIYERTHKPQREHIERRGHGKRTRK